MIPRRFQSEMLTMSRDIVARRGQGDRDVVALVFPGGGKSSLPVIMGSALKTAGLIDKICVVVPRLSLRSQNAEEFLKPHLREWLGHRLEVNEAGNDVNPSRGTDGYVTTYQTLVADQAGLHADEFRRHRYLLCLDEVHHVGDGGEWHRAVAPLYERAAFRLLMTGTLDKHDGGRIAHLNYWSPGGDVVRYPDTHIRYDLGQATGERAVIRICFPHIDGQIKYLDRSGRQVEEFTLAGDDEAARDKIYVAINTEYAEQLVTKCVESWRSYRTHNPRARLLVVCASVQQARRMQKFLTQQLGVSAAVAVSEDDSSQQTIKTFRGGLPDALVTVQMAYEGLDVPSLTHLACLTHIRSFPWLVQMFGRIMRFDREAGPWELQRAFAFVPDDPLMQKAVAYLKDGQPKGVTDDEPDSRSGSSASTTDKDGQDDDAASKVIPLNGRVTRERIVGLEPGESLDHQQTSRIKALMSEFGVCGNPADVARMLEKLQVVGADRANTEAAPSAPTSPRDRITALKKAIQSALLRIDAARGFDPGTMNKLAYQQAQGFKARDEMTEDELRNVWVWTQGQLSASGVSE